MPQTVASVVIAAHNERASITGVLDALASRRRDLEVVVSCNGCTDGTAEAARTLAPWAKVIELPMASKTAALQAGDEAAHQFPRLYLDGDIVLDGADAVKLAELVRGQVEAVAPTASYDTHGASRILRSHYRWWVAAQGERRTLTGSGAIMVSAAVRRRFDRWPDVLGDDYFLDGQVDADAKLRTTDVVVTVRLPTTLRDCLRRRARIRGGNRAIDRAGLRRSSAGADRRSTAVALLRRDPSLLMHVPAHIFVSIAADVLSAWRRLRGTDRGFYRDASRTRDSV